MKPEDYERIARDLPVCNQARLALFHAASEIRRLMDELEYHAEFNKELMEKIKNESGNLGFVIGNINDNPELLEAN